MASMRDIKRRKESVQSTGQITKAMKLVSSVKLQKAKAGAEVSKPYFETMYETVADMIAKSGQMSHPFLQKSQSGKKAVITITSNRGLAGGYNSNIVKMVSKDGRFKKEDTIIYAVGTKGRDSLSPVPDTASAPITGQCSSNGWIPFFHKVQSPFSGIAPRVKRTVLSGGQPLLFWQAVPFRVCGGLAFQMRYRTFWPW